jgi:hypothetical protein
VMFPLLNWSQDTIVSVVTRYGLGVEGIGIQFRTGVRDLSLLHSILQLIQCYRWSTLYSLLLHTHTRGFCLHYYCL